MPAISIVMPAYNAEKYLTDAVDSVLAQTFADWELSIVNDGSTDKTLAIARAYAAADNRIRVIDQKNAGTVAAKNAAIAAASGQYIFPLDSDDKIAPECLERLYNKIKSGKYAVVCPDGRTFGHSDAHINFPQATRANMYRRHTGIHNSSLYEKKYWEKYGGYDMLFADGLEDLDFWLNFLDDGQKITRISGDLFFYRMKPGDESRRLQCRQSHAGLWKIMEDKHPNMKFYKKWGPLFGLPKFFYQNSTELSTGIQKIRICRIPVRVKKPHKK